MKKKKDELSLRTMRVRDIPPHPSNPKAHDVDAIARSIERFGFRGAVVMSSSGLTSEGHGRVKALTQMHAKDPESPPDGISVEDGEWVVPVLTGAEFKSDEEERAFLIASNQLTTAGGWDTTALKGIMASLKSSEDEFDGLGFSEVECVKMIEGMDPPSDDGGSDADLPPVVPSVASLGDRWELGGHILFVGDSTAPESLRAVGGAGSFDMVLTDPPYGIGYKSRGAPDKHADIIADDDEGGALVLFDAMAQVCLAATSKGSPWYVFGPSNAPGPAMALALERVGVFRTGLAWVKHRHVLGRGDFNMRHEVIMYGWTPGAPHRWYGGHNQCGVWEFDSPNSSDLHPTMKPVAMLEHAIRLSSRKGDRVFEPFSGSGSTLLACENTGRKCGAIELHPGYADVAIYRWEQLTGKKARLAPLEAEKGQ